MSACIIQASLSRTDVKLGAAVAGLHPDGDRWCGRTVAQWLAGRLGRQVSRQLGWRYLRRLGARWLKPRPRHVQADLQAQAVFAQHLRRSCAMLRRPSHGRPLSYGRPTNIASGSSRSWPRCGRWPASAPSLLSSIILMSRVRKRCLPGASAQVYHAGQGQDERAPAPPHRRLHGLDIA